MMILNTPSRSWPIGGRPPGAGKGGEGRRVPWPSQRWCMVLPVDWLKWCRRTSVELQKGGGADGQPSLNFFNVWPAEDKPAYMSMWPRERVEEITNGTGPAQFLLDVTPEYLMNAVVPPRLKQLVPQAKVVIVLQVRFLLPPSPPPRRRVHCRCRLSCAQSGPSKAAGPCNGPGTNPRWQRGSSRASVHSARPSCMHGSRCGPMHRVSGRPSPTHTGAATPDATRTQCLGIATGGCRSVACSRYACHVVSAMLSTRPLRSRPRT